MLWFFIGKFDLSSKIFRTGFFRPIVGLLLFLLILYFGETSTLIGGILWIDLCLLLGSIPLVHGIIFLLREHHKTGRLSTISLAPKHDLFFKKQTLYFRLSVVALVLLLCSPLIVTGFGYYTGNEEAELETTVNTLIKNCRYDTEKTNAIIQWFNRTTNGTDNVGNLYYRTRENKILLEVDDLLAVFSEQPYFCVRTWDENPLWIFTTRCGRCGEYSILFMEMAHKANLTVRRITCAGEDHEWDEVYIPEENEWKIIDPTAVKLPDSTGYQSSDFMERKVAGDLHQQQGNISYVSARYPDGVKEDVTYRYTNLTNITVFITDESGLPIPDMIINVKSNNRGGERDTGLTVKTNEAGRYTIAIGGGSYTFQVQREHDIFPTTSYTSSFSEEQPQHYVNVTVKNHTLVEDIINAPLFYALMSAIIIVSAWGLIILWKRKRRR